MGAMDDAGKIKGESKEPKLPVLDGAFAVTTDGTILANNTEEGPQAGTSGSILKWTVDEHTDSAPTALIGMAK